MGHHSLQPKNVRSPQRTSEDRKRRWDPERQRNTRDPVEPAKEQPAPAPEDEQTSS